MKKLPVVGSTAAITQFCATEIEGPEGTSLWLDGNQKITAGNGTYESPMPNAFSLEAQAVVDREQAADLGTSLEIFASTARARRRRDEGNTSTDTSTGPVTITVTSTNHITNLPPTQPTKFIMVPQLLPLPVSAKAEECPSPAPRN